LLDEDTPALVDIPESIDQVYLPSLSVDPDSNVFEFGEMQFLKESIIQRRDIILGKFESLKPRVVIVDNFPFNQHRLRGEILPVVERARNGVYGESLVVSTTDSIMVDDSANGESRADIAALLLGKYFDLVIVQSDPVFARLEEFFKPNNTLQTPLYHTGFVMPDDQIRWTGGRGDTILVSAGDGRFGGTLFRTAVEAHRVLWPVSNLPMKIVAGPRLPEDEYRGLAQLADELDGLEVTRVVDSLRAEMARARCSISQCGYHTALNSITTQTPSLFVPSNANQRSEQIVRAQRLVYWGAGRLMMPHHLNAASLTHEINQLLQFWPRKVRFDTRGAANAARLIDRALHFGEIGLGSSHLSADSNNLY
jgi:predicted glycosyltransferase